ncbi:Transcriptional activator spt7 [Myotisia sp. PD_48]|nr:Transcriptional activator spt7 [Myotisia sp. PD_48]
MSLNHHHVWLPPGHLRPPDDYHDAHLSINGISRTPSRPRTPQLRSRAVLESIQGGAPISDIDPAPEEDPRIAIFRDCYQRSEAKINSLFGGKKGQVAPTVPTVESAEDPSTTDQPPSTNAQPEPQIPSRKPARKLDEEYDEYDDEEDSDSHSQPPPPLPPKAKPSLSPSESKPPPPSPPKPFLTPTPVPEIPKDVKKESADDIRKRLEQDKKATEDAARRSFHTMFYTLENDRDAMLDQQRLEESERQVEAEMSSHNSTSNVPGVQDSGHGTLSSANLGASSLTLKNLIARIDMKRHEVQASDAELRSLMSEVRKNRSKWASEDKIGQEELYEATEKVLSELKAQTEHSSAFLTRVNRRDAPDYVAIIKRPMDLGTMTKKLKALQYKSKQEFVDDLDLIWANCLKYNANPEHFLRKHALYMRKETEKLVPLIPDIVIRDRAEVEAEERRLQLAELDGAEESDDEPIMSSRGRKAPGKKSKKGAATTRIAPDAKSDTNSIADTKPVISESGRIGQDTMIEGSQHGSSTPPPGTLTPLTSIHQGMMAGQGDGMDVDGIGPPPAGQCSALLGLGSEYEDPEFKVWKQVTKKDRALVAAERHRLFKGDKINPDEHALLRTKAGMRSWIRSRKETTAEPDKHEVAPMQAKEAEPSAETLAEGIAEEEDKMLPDYYNVMSGIPDLPEQLHWIEDSEGNVVDPSEEFLRILPKGLFTAPQSKFSKRMDANIRQMQETRKICSKISIVKQMQQQSQMYQNQFQKYQPEPLVEQDIPTHVMNGDGPVISPWVCRATLQRSIGKILYHTGFEEYQPSALDAITDVATDFFRKIGETLKSYIEAPKIPNPEYSSTSTRVPEWKLPYTSEEMILHTLQAVGIDVETLESYVKDDFERHGAKLAAIHERLRSHYAELLRPAFNDSTGDGSGAFNDGSQQFVGGDFADDIDEDFFGFKELGLDKEFGLASLSVPLHLLQNRMYHAHRNQNVNSSQSASALFPSPPAYPKITIESVPSQIGLVRDFFLTKLNATNNEPLVEDLELPPKQRPMAGRPRVPASGKIPPHSTQSFGASPQKRPAPPSAFPGAKGGLAEPSKKKAKKNSGIPAPLFSTDGVVDDTSTPATGPNNTVKGATGSKVLGKPITASSARNSGPNGVKVEASGHRDTFSQDTDTSMAMDDTNGHPTINGIGNARVNGIKPQPLSTIARDRNSTNPTGMNGAD